MNACVVNAVLVGLPIDFKFKSNEFSEGEAQIKSFEQLFNKITNNEKKKVNVFYFQTIV
jgi:hypothetical protein